MTTDECPICLVNMHVEEGILLLDCCNKQVHLSCIMDWASRHESSRTCILCNQSNNFLIETQERNNNFIREPDPPERNNIRFLCKFFSGLTIVFILFIPYLIRKIK